MNENQLRWIVAVLVVAIGVAYFVWLVMTFLRFKETDDYVRKTVGDYYRTMPPLDDLLPREAE